MAKLIELHESARFCCCLAGRPVGQLASKRITGGRRERAEREEEEEEERRSWLDLSKFRAPLSIGATLSTIAAGGGNLFCSPARSLAHLQFGH